MSKGFSILGNRKDISNPMTGVMKVSADLAAIVGKNKATFFECYRILRAYIKENNLRDPENKLFFTPDKKMAKVFGSDRIPVNSMTKVLNKNLSNIPSLHSVPQETHMSSPVEPYSVVKLDNLPDEIILEIFSNLQIPGLISCGEVSKRIRRIADDETLWQKINLSNKMVPKRFLEGLLATNCKYLSLNHVLIGDPKFEVEQLNLKGNSQLKYLDLSWCKSTVEDIEVILASCHNLEKLSLARLVLTPNMISSICTQNSETLTLLNLSYCCTSLDLEAVSQILSECVNLKEINFGQSTLTAETEDYIAQNLPEWIEKLDLSSLNFSDNQIRWIYENCPKWFQYRMEIHRILGSCGLRRCGFHTCIISKKARDISLVRIPQLMREHVFGSG